MDSGPSQTASSPPPPFLELPYKIRYEIYQRVFASVPTELVLSLRIPDRHRPSERYPLQEVMQLFGRWIARYEVGIIHVCRLIHVETVRLLFKSMKFFGPSEVEPETIKSILSPFTPHFIQNICHIQLCFVVSPETLEWDANAKQFNACCAKWVQHLPELKRVDVMLKLKLDHETKATDMTVIGIARFIERLLSPLSKVEQLLLIDGLGSPYRAGDSPRFQGAERVLSLAQGTMQIKRLMATKSTALPIRQKGTK